MSLSKVGWRWLTFTAQLCCAIAFVTIGTMIMVLGPDPEPPPHATAIILVAFGWGFTYRTLFYWSALICKDGS